MNEPTGKRKRVLVTGLGVISAAGSGIFSTLESFRREERNAGQVSLFPTSLDVPVFEVASIPETFAVRGCRTLSLVMCALDEALKSAGLEGAPKYRIGVCLGTTVASQLNDLEFYRAYRNKNDAPLPVVDRYLKANIAEFVASRMGADGPVLTVVNACSSGTDAIGVALSWLKNGLCDIVIAGGADEMNLIPLCGFNSLGIVSHTLCSPFDRDRSGLNLGEGAGILILETETSAVKRGANCDVELMGYAAAADAYHLTAPRPDGKGLESAIIEAMNEAEIGPESVSFINAHGTATADNDLVEGRTLGKIFGTDVRFISTKGFTGHTLGAAGGLEAAFSVAALREGWIPGSAGFRNEDAEIGMAPVAKETKIEGRYAISTSLAFGGNNAALVLRKI